MSVTVKRYSNFVAGQTADAASGDTDEVINPSTGEPLAEGHEVLQGYLVGQRRQAPRIAPGSAGQHDERPCHGPVQALDEVAGAPLACGVGLAVLEAMRAEGLVERVRDRGPALLAELTAALEGIPMVREVRGHGYLLGVSFVDPRDGQSFLFDVTLGVSEPDTDAIDATVDYRAVRECVREASDALSYKLLESLAAATAEAIADRFPAVHSVTVRVRKPGVTWAEWTAATAARPRSSTR